MKIIFSLIYLLFIDGFMLVSLAVVALAMATQAVVYQELTFQPLYLLLFTGTLSAYNWHRLVKTKQAENPLNRVRYLRKNRLPLLMLLFSLPVLLLSLFYVNRIILIILAPLAFVTFLYSLPTRLKLWFFPVRKIPYIKVFLVALAWAAATVILPIAGDLLTQDKTTVLLALTGYFLLVLAVTIPFDIRDMESDRAFGIKTLPVVFGIRKSINISIATSLMFFMSALALGILTGKLFIPVTAMITEIILVPLLLCIKCSKNPLYHVLVLDGLLLLYGLMIVAGVYFLG